MIDVEQITACAYKNATKLSACLQKLKWGKESDVRETGSALIDMFIDVLISNKQSPFAGVALEGYVEHLGLKIENNLKIFLIDNDIAKLHAMQQEIVDEITEQSNVDKAVKGQIALMEKIEAKIVEDEGHWETGRQTRKRRLQENLVVPVRLLSAAKTSDTRFKAHKI